MSVDDLAAYTTASISIPFVTLSTVTDGKATLRRFELKILVNGTRRFFISETPNYSFDVPTEARKIRMLDLTLGKAFWSTHKIAIE
jgi:hypothetical protein